MLNKYRILLIYIALAMVTIIAFEQVREHEFINFDDVVYVTENSNVNKGLSGESFIWAFTTLRTKTGNWHPLTWLSHMVDCQLYGLKPYGHHMTNLLLHTLNALLLFWVFKRMTGAIWPSAFVAALFAIHPLHVESVAWIAERKDVLSTFFWLLTMCAYVRYTERLSIGRYMLVVLMYCLGIMSKPMVVTLPCILLLLDYWPLERFNKFSIKRLVAEKIPLFVLAAALSAVTCIAQRGAGAIGDMASTPLGSRICNALVSYVGYIQKMVYPSRLAILYPYPSGGPGLLRLIGAIVMLGIISAGAIFAFRKRRYLIIGWLWYLGTLVPVIGLVKVGSQAMADRYTYIPLIGIFIIIAWGAKEFLSRLPHLKIVFGAFASILFIALLISTRMQVNHWKDTSTLYEHTLKVTENNFVILSHYGNTLKEDGRIEEAIDYCRKSLRVNPDYAGAHNNLGNALLSQDKVEEAIDHFQQAVQLSPDLTEAHYNLGVAFAALGKIEQAIDHYQQALKLNPDDVVTHNNMAILLGKCGKVEEAIAHCHRILQIDPSNVNAYNNLGHVFVSLGKVEQGIGYYQKALQIKPDFAQVHFKLGTALVSLGKLEQAIDHFQQVLKFKPDYIDAHNNLGVVLGEIGEFEQAVEHYKQALQLNPDYASAHNNLAWVLATVDDDNVCDPAEAVRFAKRACELTNYSNPDFLDTLAIAYAAVGDFSKAIETAVRAIQLAGDNEALAGEIQGRLELYKSNRPYREIQPAENNTNPDK
jgi:tetratricopeptide (TPR) repeat protein